ncbi:MAG: hypothetical protein FWB95_07015 [Treponema sp.]|nr:hypothetical protein [Treponema sp.]
MITRIAKFGFILLFLCFFSPLWAQEFDFFGKNRFFTNDMLTKRPAPDDTAVLTQKPPAGAAALPAEDTNSAENALHGKEAGIIAGSFSGEDDSFVEEPQIGAQSGAAAAAVTGDLDDFDDLMLYFESSALVFEAAPVLESRSFNDIFPNLSVSQIRTVKSERGLRNAFEKNESPILFPAQDSGIDLNDYVMNKKPSHIVEALVLVPYVKRELEMLDAYNAMREISAIKEHTIPYRNGQYKVFNDSTRLENAKNRKPIPDPAPADTLPYTETLYLRLTDATIGELFIQGDITPGLYGITYSMTNFRDVNYSIFRVMKAQRFSAIIYVEPVKEGILIYSMSGLYLPGFIASRVNLPSNMNHRITVLLNWIIDGLRRQETEREKSVPFAVH